MKLPPDCPPVRLTVSKPVAEQMALRSFWRGSVFGAVVMGLAIGIGAASAAWSLDISGSKVTMEPPADPSAFADVVFYNDLSNGPTDTGAYILQDFGVVIGIKFTWDASFIGADQIIVTPPMGMTCIPVDCTVTVIEGQTGRVALFEFVGM